MKIQSIQIKNLASFAEFRTELGAVNLIEGPHGAGKTSLERVIMYALGRRPLAERGSRSVQHDPSILHGTSDAGEAILTFTSESDVEFLRVNVKADKTQRQVKVRGPKQRWEDANGFIDEVTSALAYDPLQFKELDPKSRLEAFLRVVPINISDEEIHEAVGYPIELPGAAGLDTINTLYDAIFADRRTENTAADTQGKYASQLEAALAPAVDGSDWSAEVSRLRGEKALLEVSEGEELRRISAAFNKQKEELSAAAGKQREKVAEGYNLGFSAIDAKIAALQLEKEQLRSEMTDVRNLLDGSLLSDIAATRENAIKEAAEIRATNAPLAEKLNTEITVAEERSKSASRDEGTKASAVEARRQANIHKANSDAMTAALERLTTLKSTVASRMTIKGVTIAAPRVGQPVDICREENGALIPFSLWNDESQDTFCLRMAVLFSGQCGIVMLDNLNNFNATRQAEVIATCKKIAASKGMQFLLGRATMDAELKVVEV